MAKTLTTQTHLWPTDGRIFGDGAPLHSMIAYDSVRALNNLQSYLQPCFQFAFNAGYPTFENTTYQLLAATPSEGTGFLCQFPVLLPVGAKRLMITMGLTREKQIEAAITVDVTNVKFYLTPVPLAKLQDDGTFVPSFSIDQAYAVHEVAISATSGGAGDARPVYTLLDDTSTGWTGFLDASWVNGLSTGAPWAFLVVAFDYENASIANDSAAEFVRMKEFSIWGQYE